MEVWSRVLVLSLGGMLGVNARYWVGVGLSRWVASHWGTFVINASGSFAIGFLTTALTHWLPHPHARLAILTGFLGGYTTFSTFAFESVTLWQRGERGAAAFNMAGSVATGFLAAFLGIILARDLFPSYGASQASADAPRSAAFEQGANDATATVDEEGS
ncbi:fluoride efflux transporter FluC [Planctomyces sp. SH-PL62]|uniref:fluoride efflux transporter FluC n=1 Tax=Planctomyces sp. SH-PL62 TaxID=1636152 RepID=UPI00078B28E7|nr:CrcB family protein [Planctomyces sp. SH-PL62]AMV40429.1 camphor resistance protein CrcB [Planctomyces sp. SH-PL62]